MMHLGLIVKVALTNRLLQVLGLPDIVYLADD